MRDRLSSLIAIVLLALVTATSYWYARTLRIPTGAVASAPGTPDFEADRLVITTFDEQGRAKHKLFADKLLHYADNDNVDLTAPRLTAALRLFEGEERRGDVAVRISDLGQDGTLTDRLMRGRLDARLAFDGAAETLWRLSGVEVLDFSGPLRIAARATGTLGNPRITGTLAKVAPKSLLHLGAHLVVVLDERAQLGLQQLHQVEPAAGTGRRAVGLVGARRWPDAERAQQRMGPGVEVDDVVPGVEHQSRIGGMGIEQAPHHELHPGQRLVGERMLRIDRREAGSGEQRVVFGGGQGECGGQPLHHARRGARAAGFEKGHMTRRCAGHARQLELAQTAEGAPVPQRLAKGGHHSRGHGFGRRRDRTGVSNASLGSCQSRFPGRESPLTNCGVTVRSWPAAATPFPFCRSAHGQSDCCCLVPPPCG